MGEASQEYQRRFGSRDPEISMKALERGTVDEIAEAFPTPYEIQAALEQAADAWFGPRSPLMRKLAEAQAGRSSATNRATPPGSG